MRVDGDAAARYPEGMRYRFALIAPLALASAGFTECESFDYVVVPPSDPSPPQIFFGLSNGDRYERLAQAPVSFEHTDANRQVSAVVSAHDPGGVRRLQVGWSTRRHCSGGDGVGVVISPLVEPEQDSQAGGVGSEVSNGIWLGHWFWPERMAGCPRGYQLDGVTLEWSAEAENFHGGITRSHGSVWWSAP
jgi:hypothetical protein